MALNKQAQYGLDVVDEETFRIRLRIGKVIGRCINTEVQFTITFQHFHNKKYFSWIMKTRQAVTVANSRIVVLIGRIVVLIRR